MLDQFEKITCEHAGTSLRGFVSRQAGPGPWPAVIAYHGGYGFDEQLAEAAHALTELGYLVVGADMYGEDAAPSTPEAARALMEGLLQDPELLRDRATLWYRAAATIPFIDETRIAAIGYGFGGMCALELARSGADLRAVSTFYPVLRTAMPAEPGTITARVAAWCGALDPFAPPEDVTALRAELAGTDFEIHEFEYAGHGFTNPESDSRGQPGTAYDAGASKAAWEGTLALLDATLKQDADENA